jgi:oxygen-independent coproporphyrinogen-3 oxidase
VQNYKGLKDFYRAVDQQNAPIEKLVKLGKPDNLLRRDVIMELMCHFRLDKREISQTYGIDFNEYFALDLQMLNEFENDGLVINGCDILEVTPSGRLMVRNIAYCFDAYSRDRKQQRFSKSI